MSNPSATLSASGNVSGTTLTPMVAPGTTAGDTDFTALLSNDQGGTVMTLVFTGGSVATTITAIGRKSPKPSHPTHSTLGQLVGQAIPTGGVTLTYVDYWGFTQPTSGVASGYGVLGVGVDVSDSESYVGPNVAVHNNDASATALSTSMPGNELDIWIQFSDLSQCTATLTAAANTTVAIQPLLH